MNPAQAPAPAISRRAHAEAESLVENSSLRDGLDDAQAQQLLDWGLARLQATAALTAALADDEAEAIMDEEGTAVRAIMRQINQLTTAPETADRPALHQFLRAIDRLHGATVSLPQSFRAERLAGRLTPADAFDRLLSLLTEVAAS